MLNIRKWHKIAGIILILPMIVWSITGAIFFIKPGYGDAYAQLKVKSYTNTVTQQQLKQGWDKVTLIHTVLGSHLLVSDNGKSLHLDAKTLEQWPKPDIATQHRLVTDAITQNKSRYGDIVDVKDGQFVTSTGVEISLNWQNLSLYQKGLDTKRINFIYQLHYLQWTGNKTLDQVLGMFGLILLVTLTLLGTRLLFRK